MIKLRFLFALCLVGLGSALSVGCSSGGGEAAPVEVTVEEQATMDDVGKVPNQ